MKFDKRLVLNQWLLSLFEVDSIDEFYGIMRDASEGYDENNVSRFYHRITERLIEPKFPKNYNYATPGMGTSRVLRICR